MTKKNRQMSIKMISQEKLKIFTPLQKLPKNVGNLGKLIVAKGFEKWPKVQSITQSGYTALDQSTVSTTTIYDHIIARLWLQLILLMVPSNKCTAKRTVIGQAAFL